MKTTKALKKTFSILNLQENFDIKIRDREMFGIERCLR